MEGGRDRERSQCGLQGLHHMSELLIWKRIKPWSIG